LVIRALALGEVTLRDWWRVMRREILAGLSLGAILGSITLQAVPLSIGALVANAVFARRGSDDSSGDVASPRTMWGATLNTLAATVVGAVFISMAIAPTDEIPMLAAGLGAARLVALIGLSLLLSYLIGYVSGFDPEQGPNQSHGIFRTPMTVTAVTYLVSLLVAFGALLVFAHISPGDLPSSLPNALALTVVLGLPASIGGAAGRLVV
jgi:putative integral membrane protein (TIGR02587 family)